MQGHTEHTYPLELCQDWIPPLSLPEAEQRRVGAVRRDRGGQKEKEG